LEVRDRGAPQYEGRFLYRWEEPVPGERWFGLELEAGGSDGSSRQDLDLGDQVVFGGQSFPGPGRLDVDYEWRRLGLGLATGRESEDVEARGRLGLAWQDLRLSLEQGSQRAHGSDGWVGVLAGFDFLWAFSDWIGLEMRAELSTRLTKQSGELEFAAALAPRSPVQLLVGWRWIDAYSALESESDVDLSLQGPVVALRAGF